ncbi:hypothetical protein NPIL_668491 [Nephila pilipes]|uniref:Uncharacterized protein n=1 Tax=Nephila pilipes TaxID=299642 RepID=A0A8X6NVZ9_NEPPI|nr:hypothetical protein NPIL_668491 [Nephila pilipes]
MPARLHFGSQRNLQDIQSEKIEQTTDLVKDSKFSQYLLPILGERLKRAAGRTGEWPCGGKAPPATRDCSHGSGEFLSHLSRRVSTRRGQLTLRVWVSYDPQTGEASSPGRPEAAMRVRKFGVQCVLQFNQLSQQAAFFIDPHPNEKEATIHIDIHPRRRRRPGHERRRLNRRQETPYGRAPAEEETTTTTQSPERNAPNPKPEPEPNAQSTGRPLPP